VLYGEIEGCQTPAEWARDLPHAFENQADSDTVSGCLPMPAGPRWQDHKAIVTSSRAADRLGFGRGRATFEACR
jgi:hypothetical protein